ncbi:MAG: magnesium transporter CorA family protein [Desulfobacteraceae bacterium]|nr:MAG: magnesium transporter CorA family protein [Desulfobacteraceae bacterium]
MQKNYEVDAGKLREGGRDPLPVMVFINPDADEKRMLIDEFKIDEHTLNSALDPDEVSRLEFEPSHVALIFKMPRNYSEKDQLLFRVASTGAFLFKDRLIVVIPDDIPLFNGKPFTKVQSFTDLLLRLVSRSISHFRDHLKAINMLTDELEHKINTSMENRYLINLFTLEKSLVYFLNAINANGVVMEKLKHSAAKIGFSTEEVELLDDIIIENNQCNKQAEIYSNILASLMDARVSIVSNNLNILIKFLNIITIAIMVPTFVVSAFSMNVPLPMRSDSFSFWIIMGLAILSVLGFMIFWKFKKW